MTIGEILSGKDKVAHLTTVTQQPLNHQEKFVPVNVGGRDVVYYFSV
jgi:hypothetical protein